MNQEHQTGLAQVGQVKVSPLFEFRDLAVAIDIAVTTRVLASNTPVERGTILFQVRGRHLACVDTLLQGCSQTHVDIRIRHVELFQHPIFTAKTKFTYECVDVVPKSAGHG